MTFTTNNKSFTGNNICEVFTNRLVCESVLRKLSGRETKVILILSIVVPVSFLAALKLTGLLTGPSKPIEVAQTVSLEAVSFEAERPDVPIRVMGSPEVQSVYVDEIELTQIIKLDVFSPDDWLFGRDTLYFRVNVTASLREGFIVSVNVTFRENYCSSEIVMYRAGPGGEASGGAAITLQNLSVVNYAKFRFQEGVKAFYTLNANSDARQVRFHHPVEWVLGSPYNTTHLLEVTTDFVYYNGTVYKRVVQPFTIKLISDDNNSPQTATELHEGVYTGLWLGKIDSRDFYKIYTEERQTITLHIYVPWGELLYSAYIYNPDGTLAVASDLENDRTFDFTLNSTGYSTIKVERALSTVGFYEMRVNS